MPRVAVDVLAIFLRSLFCKRSSGGVLPAEKVAGKRLLVVVNSFDLLEVTSDMEISVLITFDPGGHS